MTALNETEQLQRLANFELFRNFTQDELVGLLRKSVVVERPSGKGFVKQGDTASYVFLLLQGLACVYRRLPDDRQGAREIRGEKEFRSITLHFLKEYVPIGEVEAVMGSARVASVRGVTELYMLRLSSSDFIDAIASHYKDLAETICQKVCLTVPYFERTALASKAARMLDVIELYAAYRNLVADAEGFLTITEEMKPARVGKFADSGKPHREKFFKRLEQTGSVLYTDVAHEAYRINLAKARSFLNARKSDYAEDGEDI